MYYKITTEEEKFFIESITGSISVIVKKETCSGYEEVQNIIVEQDPVEIAKDFGTYKIFINKTGEQPQTTTIHNYIEILKCITEALKKIFCDNCKGCDDKSKYDECNLYFNAIYKLLSYARFMDPYIVSFISQVFKQAKCEDVEDMYCFLGDECINGGFSDAKSRVEKLLAIYYIGIRMYYEQNEDSEVLHSLVYIDKVLDFKNIICCIQNKTPYKYSDFVDGLDDLNSPPLIGDYSTLVTAPLTYEEYTLTVDMFTTLTDPVYSDPEGDSAYKVRIDVLPSFHVLKLNNVPVTVGQEILVTEILDGNLILVSPEGVAHNVYDNFEFSVSDEGSQQFTNTVLQN